MSPWKGPFAVRSCPSPLFIVFPRASNPKKSRKYDCIKPCYAQFAVHQSAAPVKTPSFARPSREKSFCFFSEHRIAPRPDSPFVFSFRYVRQLTTNGCIRWNHHHRVSSAPDPAPFFFGSLGVDSSNAVHTRCFPRLCMIIFIYTRYKQYMLYLLTSVQSVCAYYYDYVGRRYDRQLDIFIQTRKEHATYRPSL